MSKMIKLKMYPFGYHIAFDTTGIDIRSISQDQDSRAIINGDIEVVETFREVLFMIDKNHLY